MKLEKKIKDEPRKPRVLVGDDQIGVPESPSYLNFMDNYRELADFEFTADPTDFVEKAKTGYDVLMIDLKWDPEDATREYKTGYAVLEAVKDYAPIRALWTSESAEHREKGFQYGATHCIPKGISPEKLEAIIKK